MIQTEEQTLMIVERRMLRRIYDLARKKNSGKYRIRKNHELGLMELLYEKQDNTTAIRAHQINSMRHIQRMSVKKMPEKLLNSEYEGTRMRRRPRKR